MATNPNDLENDDRGRTAEEAAALALLLARRRYDLPQLIRQTGARTKPFRRIGATEALRSSMASPYFDLVRAWQAQRPALLTAYASALPSGSMGEVQRQVDASAAEIERQLYALKRRFPAILARIEQWHRAEWLRRVRTSTGLDVGVFTAAADVAEPVDNARVWNEQLLDDVHQQAKGRISAGLIAALAVGGFVRRAGAPRSRAGGSGAISEPGTGGAGASPAPAERATPSADEIITEALAKAKRRSANIGVDQTDKVIGGMTRARRQAAGLDNWIWRHLDPQRFPRPEHQARDGRTYNTRTAPRDAPGVLPNCKCWEEPLWD